MENTDIYSQDLLEEIPPKVFPNAVVQDDLSTFPVHLKPDLQHWIKLHTTMTTDPHGIMLPGDEKSKGFLLSHSQTTVHNAAQNQIQNQNTIITSDETPSQNYCFDTSIT